MNKPQVQIYERDVYGVTRIYPANEAAEIFAAIAGTKTLSKDDIKHIQQLGFETVRVFAPRDHSVVTPGYGGKSW